MNRQESANRNAAGRVVRNAIQTAPVNRTGRAGHIVARPAPPSRKQQVFVQVVRCVQVNRSRHGR